MVGFVMVSHDTIEVKLAPGGMCRWAVLLSFFVALAAFAEPPAPTYSIADFVTCGDAKMEPPHDWHVPQSVFQTGDEQFFAWLELTNVEGAHAVVLKVFRPDGTYYGKETQTLHETNGMADWCRVAAWWKIKGYGPAQSPGRWKMELIIDGDVQRSIYFDIQGKPEPAAPALTNSILANVGQKGRMCVFEVSSDLTHWAPIQTNNLPSGLPQAAITAQGGFRLIPVGGGVPNFILEVSPDLLNWTPVQTNSLSPRSAWDAPATARFYRAAIH